MSARRRPGREPERVVGGLHPVRELLRADADVREVLIARGREPSAVLDEIRRLADAAGVRVETATREHLDDRAEGLVHQGVLAVAAPYAYARLDEVLAGAREQGTPPLLVALDGVTDPHNLGSIARTAEAVGAHGLLVPARRSAGISAGAEKAAAGALAHLPVVRCTNLVRTLDDCRQRHVWVVGLDGDGPEPIGASGLLVEPLVVVVGAEGRGLARLTREACDVLAHLPMRGAVGSLNASVAAGVALYEILRQRDAAAGAD